MLYFDAATNWWPLLAGVIGLNIGSYLHVVALRWFSQQAESPQNLKNRSRCPQCGATLRWYELLPVISFFVQRGRCRSCKGSIHWRYPLIELVCSLVFAGIAWRFGMSWQTGFLLVVASVLIVVGLIDLDTQFIPDRLLLPLAIVATVVIVVAGWANATAQTGTILGSSWYVGAALGAGSIGVIVAVTRGRGMGIGDIKLAGILGILLGGSQVLVALFAAFVIGAFVGLSLIASKRLTLKSRLPFGPFLILGWFIALIWGPAILSWYTGS